MNLSPEIRARISEAKKRNPLGAKRPYKDAAWLRRKYLVEGLSTREIAEPFGITGGAIWNWLKKHKIPIRSQSEASSGPRSVSWKGGRTHDSHGYILIYKPEHPRANVHGQVFEHILVLERKLGRPLSPKEVSHHINGIRDDNDPENLTVFSSRAHHTAYHRKIEK